MKQIPQDKWKWLGMPAHFCAASYCRFHMATIVGKYLVSSVGCMIKNPEDNSPLENVGCNRKYEAFVFKTKKGFCECGCELPNFEGSEIDALPANDAKTAQKNHMIMCNKYANL